MAKRKKSERKKPKPKRSEATLRDVLGVVGKPKVTYRCLGCGNEGPPREMLIDVMMGDKVRVKASVCRFCHEERMKKDASEQSTGSSVFEQV